MTNDKRRAQSGTVGNAKCVDPGASDGGGRDGTGVDRRKDGMIKKKQRKRRNELEVPYTPACNRCFVTKCLEVPTGSVSFQASAPVGLRCASLTHGTSYL